MQTTNSVNIKGVLLENDLKKDVINNKNCVRGSIVLGVADSRVRVDFFSNEFTNSNKENPSYAGLITLMNEGRCQNVDDASVIPSYIAVKDATLANNDYFGPDGNLISAVRINGSFANILKAAPAAEEIKAIFNFDGFIESIVPEMKDEVETGRLNVNMIGIEYNGCANPIQFTVPAQSAPSYQQAFNSGDSCNISGYIVNILTTSTTVSQVGWGEAQPQTKTTVVREHLATGGSMPFADSDAKYVSADAVAEAKAARVKKLEDVKNKAAQNQAKKQQAAQAATGFTGNPNAFANSVQQPAMGGQNAFFGGASPNPTGGPKF